jgi:prophage regulatory protein
MTTATPDRILRIAAVLARTGLTRSTLYRKIQQGTFPKQVRIAARCAGWRESAVNAWLQNPMFYRVEDQLGARSEPASC